MFIKGVLAESRGWWGKYTQFIITKVRHLSNPFARRPAMMMERHYHFGQARTGCSQREQRGHELEDE